MKSRRYDLDNIRWFVIVLVFLHHICYMFNSEGLRGHFWSEGIPAMDLFSHIVYPWFIGILFLIAGIAVRYSLKESITAIQSSNENSGAQRTTKEFRKERFAKLMRPFLSGMFLMSPVITYHMFQTQGTLQEVYQGMGDVPMGVKYVELWFMCFLIGMAQLWFIAELYLFSRLFLWLKKTKLHKKLLVVGEKSYASEKNIGIALTTMGILYIVLCKTVDWYCGINYTMTGLVLVLRPQVYFFLFLAGYYVFAKSEVAKFLENKVAFFLALAIILGFVQCLYTYGGTSTGENGMYDYTISCNFILPAMYAYIAMLAILGIGKRWFYKQTSFRAYMTDRSFGFYIFHYIVLMYIGDLASNYFGFSGLPLYLMTFVFGALGTILLTELVRRIPGLRWLFGIKPSTHTKQTNL